MNKKQYEQMIEAENSRASKNKLNGYYCYSCEKISIVCKDVDNGVTPAMMTCPLCDGQAWSRYYQLEPALEVFVNSEWYRPTYQEFLKIKHEPTKTHIAQGGLIFRKLANYPMNKHLTKSDIKEISNYRKFRQERRQKHKNLKTPRSVNGQKLGLRKRLEMTNK